MEYNKKGPFIHLFQTPLGYYFYDVNTNQIIKINNDIYTILQNYTEECKNNEQILKLYEAGLLKTNRVQKIKHPYTELLPYALKRKVHILILQITQNCNLRCEYCLYSGGYKTRKHQNKRMNWITAKEAIDFLKAHSNEKKKVYIAFYGGEPLLEFELIPKILDHSSVEESMEESEKLADIMGVRTLMDKRTFELSGGEKQRVAICRALINHSDLILADEPTGNLDSASSETVMEYLQMINKDMKKTVVLVTHDAYVASFCNRVIFVKDGMIEVELKKTEGQDEFCDQIMKEQKKILKR